MATSQWALMANFSSLMLRYRPLVMCGSHFQWVLGTPA
jgi:hypothetical protein